MSEAPKRPGYPQLVLTMTPTLVYFDITALPGMEVIVPIAAHFGNQELLLGVLAGWLQEARKAAQAGAR